MRDHDPQGEVVTPRSLDEKSGFEWRQLSAQVLEGRLTGAGSGINVTLEHAAEREPQSPLSGAYWLWMAENLAREGRARESFPLYDKAIERLDTNPPLVETIDGLGGALLAKAQNAALVGDGKIAVEAYSNLALHLPGDPDPLFQAGLIMEAAGDQAAAADFYRRAPAKSERRHRHKAEWARRCLARLDTPDTAFSDSPDQVVDLIKAALASGSGEALRKIATTTHFAIGLMASESDFEDEIFLDRLCSELSSGKVRAQGPIWGRGDKRYLLTTGWKGGWFQGEVFFVITRSARGWQWTGCGIATPNDLWLDHWRSPRPQSNDPLPFELLAPWPSGLCCEAGGLSGYIAEQALVAAAAALPWPVGPIAAAALIVGFSARDCGFGVRGFYYDNSPTHDEEDFFSIDFTRYQRFVPYINRSDGTPVLAPRGGIVSRVSEGTPSGSDTASNTVEIQHGDPADPSNTDRFTSRYLHMQGPNLIEPMLMAPIFTGNRIGLMDDTGRSVASHLHFSIHDRQLPYPNYTPGSSVRPTPMNGVRLEDGDSGTCVCSTNVETFGEKPMIFPTGFATQNWVIVPVATASGQTPPANIREQRWQLVLSGVVLIDMKGVTTAQWRRETLLIQPDLKPPAKFAAQRFGVPLPPGGDGAYYANFQVEQWAPFSTLSSVFNANQSVNSGFAVDAWRPNAFFSATDLATNAPASDLFAGIQADIAVRDSDAYLYRVGYHITLIGRIVFSPVIIT